MSVRRIALLGLGEVGGALAGALGQAGVFELLAWDVRLDEAGGAPARNAARHGVRCARSGAEAAAGADLVISAVTAAQCLAAARDCAPGLRAGAYVLDLNSASPAAKRSAACVVEAAGGRYVEAAVMSPIAPLGIGSPMLLGGPHAADFLQAAHGLGFSGARVYAGEVGRAAALKLCRSVVIKGVEALLAESLLAARFYGVEGEVLASLSNLLPAPDWPVRARYMISRSLEHGARRAEEMREAALTVSEAGVEPLMSAATAERQAWAGAHGEASAIVDLKAMLDAMAGAPAPGRRRTTG